jgi:hypothetical protein
MRSRKADNNKVTSLAGVAAPAMKLRSVCDNGGFSITLQDFSTMKANIILLTVAFGLSVVPEATAQLLGTFTKTGSLTTARSGHTATVLANGKVLIAGGLNFPGSGPDVYHFLASAELYDPATGLSSPTGDMITARARHSATLLPGGKVLIVGGSSDTNVTSAELYDSVTGTFSATGGITTANCTATLLKNGKVLIAGDIAQLYDPVTNSFTLTGPYSGPFPPGQSFFPETATLLQDGRVLVAGCGDNSGAWLEHEELYDPSAGIFTLAGKVHTLSSGKTTRRRCSPTERCYWPVVSTRILVFLIPPNFTTHRSTHSPAPGARS